ncbi:MAG: D-2-hydroxyacid dehydrogenase [Streptosporangiales bacterium]|nr:D-2-hydroxyacid dehydrogenase [Streptosporangiales bacterium]
MTAVLCDESGAPDLSEVEDLTELRLATGHDLASVLPGAQALFVWDFTSAALADVWPSASTLRWVHTASAGVDRLLFPGLVGSDVVVTNSRGVFEQAIAEYVLGCILAFAKDLTGTVTLQAERRWRHRESERIAGRRALIIGTGPIGRATARLLAAADMRVAGLGRRSRTGDPDFGRVHAQGDLLEVLGWADYVVMAAPLTEQTCGMLDRTAFRSMKPSARLVNVGRGPTVVEDDLVDALRNGEIAGAALDVFTEEPLPATSALWDMPGLIVSPHMSGDAEGWEDELVRLFAENLRHWQTGQPLRNVVDKQLGYVPTSG